MFGTGGAESLVAVKREGKGYAPIKSTIGTGLHGLLRSSSASAVVSMVDATEDERHLQPKDDASVRQSAPISGEMECWKAGSGSLCSFVGTSRRVAGSGGVAAPVSLGVDRSGGDGGGGAARLAAEAGVCLVLNSAGEVVGLAPATDFAAGAREGAKAWARSVSIGPMVTLARDAPRGEGQAEAGMELPLRIAVSSAGGESQSQEGVLRIDDPSDVASAVFDGDSFPDGALVFVGAPEVRVSLAPGDRVVTELGGEGVNAWMGAVENVALAGQAEVEAALAAAAEGKEGAVA